MCLIAKSSFYFVSLHKKISKKYKIIFETHYETHPLTPAQVILFQVPLEMGWTYTVSWRADDLTCRVMVFVRIVGFYLSGFVMMVISIDRLMAIMHPVTHRSRILDRDTANSYTMVLLLAAKASQ